MNQPSANHGQGNEKIKIDADKIIVVASGKGGVGKSTVAVNLALSLASKGKKVGIMDADLYGPNIPLMLGVENTRIDLSVDSEGQLTAPIEPLKKYGLQIMSRDLIWNPASAFAMFDPLAMKHLDILLAQTNWQDLDYFIIDLPPGTGGIPLAIARKLDISSGILVTTPQEASVADVKKMVNLFTMMKTPIMGIVENMRYVECPECKTKTDLFPGIRLNEIREFKNYNILAQFPFEPAIGMKGADGLPYYLQNKESSVSKEYNRLAEQVINY